MRTAVQEIHSPLVLIHPVSVNSVTMIWRIPKKQVHLKFHRLCRCDLESTNVTIAIILSVQLNSLNDTRPGVIPHPTANLMMSLLRRKCPFSRYLLFSVSCDFGFFMSPASLFCFHLNLIKLNPMKRVLGCLCPATWFS